LSIDVPRLLVSAECSDDSVATVVILMCHLGRGFASGLMVVFGVDPLRVLLSSARC
jgi:hypothetical protein